ncbi:YicC family protein [Alkalilimnicola ehrlichii]|uniref:YicC family protein n=1 Tax=Alkalilimnicola ehrlichii TaxID=351052 RepID=A0A3E0X235_9GAMM|nr:YicC/YloC family endoribonuclease [Alkalilimnicola ehrlichii]RFA31168.1 YicC family protein [Alkalilimnicola ehrlichii]RFA39547.1 YicC family protein [Alkalilimnicola ehrlichii]
MIRSMTAFERQEYQGEWGKLTWELRSVNHRYLDIYPRLPEELRHLEPALRERLSARLSRGKVECNLRFRPVAGVSADVELNWPYVEKLLSASNALGERIGGATPINPLELMRMPGVMKDVEQDMEPISKAALALLEKTLDGFVAGREREGVRLAEIVRDRAHKVAELVAKVRERRPQVNAYVREKLMARIQDMEATADPGRIEQELVIVAQRLDVDEELERLATHVTEVERVLTKREPVGRRLDFLMQELNREANTLTSKAADTETTNAAVEMKVLIEQMREQIQNIE